MIRKSDGDSPDFSNNQFEWAQRLKKTFKLIPSWLRKSKWLTPEEKLKLWEHPIAEPIRHPVLRAVCDRIEAHRDPAQKKSNNTIDNLDEVLYWEAQNQLCLRHEGLIGNRDKLELAVLTAFAKSHTNEEYRAIVQQVITNTDTAMLSFVAAMLERLEPFDALNVFICAMARSPGRSGE